MLCSLRSRTLPERWIVNKLTLWLTIHCESQSIVIQSTLFSDFILNCCLQYEDTHRQKRQDLVTNDHFEAIVLRISNTTFFQRFSEFGVDSADRGQCASYSLLEWLTSILCKLIYVVMGFINAIQFLKFPSFFHNIHLFKLLLVRLNYLYICYLSNCSYSLITGIL